MLSALMNSLTSVPRSLKYDQNQRRALPAQLRPREDYSIWEIIKPNIGKDFSRFSVPVFLNEPLCFLQRLSEFMDYVDLIEIAASKDDPVERISYIGAFTVAALSSNWNRLSKPFNPLLLETFEVERNGVRFIAEQVSHHPPISAIHVEGKNFSIEATVSPKMSLGINKLICTPEGGFELTLHNRNEVYTYMAPACTIYNVMMGKMYMNLTGHLNVNCVQTGLSINLSVDAGRGWHVKSTDVHIDGYIEKGKTKLRAIYGNWSYFLASCPVETFKLNHSSYIKFFMTSLQPGNENMAPLLSDSKVLWTANQLVSNYEKNFFFTPFVLSLNELTDELRKKLPPTDSRFRPDIVALENGLCDRAESAKHALEESQRSRRKQGVGNEPLWFKFDGKKWKYSGKYFDRDWTDCTDIFDNNVSDVINNHSSKQ
ncbi:unnamed protein product [Auanema sp. JU1783]|nr:unnamed protein product [Auanema sp. JU1783]